jgi:hypothetical protein
MVVQESAAVQVLRLARDALLMKDVRYKLKQPMFCFSFDERKKNSFSYFSLMCLQLCNHDTGRPWL